MDAPAFVENFDPVWIAIPFFVLSVFGEMLFARFTGKAQRMSMSVSVRETTSPETTTGEG